MKSYHKVLWGYLKKHPRDIRQIGVHAFGHQSNKYFHIHLEIEHLETQVMSEFESLNEAIRVMDRILDISQK